MDYSQSSVSLWSEIFNHAVHHFMHDSIKTKFKREINLNALKKGNIKQKVS